MFNTLLTGKGKDTWFVVFAVVQINTPDIGLGHFQATKVTITE